MKKPEINKLVLPVKIRFPKPVEFRPIIYVRPFRTLCCLRRNGRRPEFRDAANHRIEE